MVVINRWIGLEPNTMKALLFGAVAISLGLSTTAEAASRKPADIEAVMDPLRLAATQCFAETVLSNPKAILLAKARRWYEAVGIVGFLCRPEVDAMIQAHDRLYGPGSGKQYFKMRYAHQLDRELATQLQPLLDRKAVASAEPLPEEASVSDSTTETAERNRN